MKGDKVAQKYLAECLDCTRQIVASVLTLAIKYRLVLSQRGYVPTDGWHPLNTATDGFRLDLLCVVM
jgi:hypothetical protein